jgi:multidrug transporter EmrE-like cation transporter
MNGLARRTASIRQKALREFKEMAALALYLYICLGAVVLLKAAVLQEVGVHFAIWGIAAVKALLLAKFMLLGRGLQVGRRFKDRPLIWPTLYHALIFLFLLLVLTTIEEIVVGSIRHRPLFDSLTHVVGHTVFEGFSICLVLFLILVPYSAFVCLADVLGERETLRLFFVEGSRAISAQSHPTAY